MEAAIRGSNSPVRRSGTPSQLLGVLLHTTAIFGLSRVRCPSPKPRVPDPAKRWLTFLLNHREAIAAMDFFTVPTLTFGVLYCFFVIGHDRRKILRFNVTR